MKKNPIYKPVKNSNAKKYSPQKESASAKGYDTVWNKYRFRFLWYNPKCYVCSDKATVVDHVVAHKGDVDLFRKETNHIPLCKACHDHATANYDRYKPPLTSEKLKWIFERRKELGVTIKVKVLDKFEK